MPNLDYMELVSSNSKDIMSDWLLFMPICVPALSASALNHRVFAMSDVPIFRNKQRQHIVGSFQFITELNLIKHPGPRYNIYPPEMICSVFETSSLHGLRTLSPSLHSVPNIEIKTMQWSNQCNLHACTQSLLDVSISFSGTIGIHQNNINKFKLSDQIKSHRKFI